MKTPAARADLWAAALLTLFGVVASVAAGSLSFGGVTRPGPGFLPTCLALALTLVAAAVLFRAVVGSTDGWADSTRRGRTRSNPNRPASADCASGFR